MILGGLAERRQLSKCRSAFFCLAEVFVSKFALIVQERLSCGEFSVLAFKELRRASSFNTRTFHLRRTLRFCFGRTSDSASMGKGGVAATFCEILIAILLPPLGVFLKYACGLEFWICLLLTILGYIPGILYALYVIVA